MGTQFNKKVTAKLPRVIIFFFLLVSVPFVFSFAANALTYAYQQATNNYNQQDTATSYGETINYPNFSRSTTINQIAWYFKANSDFGYVRATVGDYDGANANAGYSDNCIATSDALNPDYRIFDFTGFSTQNDATQLFLQLVYFDTLENCESYLGLHNGDIQIYGKFVSGFSAYIQAGDTVEGAELTITQPVHESFLPITNHELTGTCPFNSSNALKVIDQPQPWPTTTETYNVDCTNHAFTTTFNPRVGTHEICVVDVRYVLIEHPDPTQGVGVTCNSYNGIAENYEYGINLLYPECTNASCALEPGEWVFRFAYMIPENELETTTFEIYSDCSSDYDSCTTTNVNNTPSVFDPDELGYVDTTSPKIDLTTPSNNYIKALIINENDVVKYEFKLKATSVESGGITHQDPDTNDLGVWGNLIRTLFVPSRSFLRIFSEDLPDLLRTKVPFAYFYAVSDKITNVNISNTNYSLSLPVAISNTNYNIPVIPAGESQLKNILDNARPYFNYLLWLLALIYFYETLKHINL